MILTEAQEQAALMEWAGYMIGKYPELKWLFHIPNGGSRNAIEAHNLKHQGVKPGVPDLCLPVPCGKYHGLFIEMKRQKNSRVSVEQKIWLNWLNEKGYKAVVCYGWGDAKKVIEEYLNDRAL